MGCFRSESTTYLQYLSVVEGSSNVLFPLKFKFDLKWFQSKSPGVGRLTPELSRTAARNGGVVHVTMQPSREAVSA